MTIGILSWGARGTLINTLESYKKHNLNDLDDEKVQTNFMTRVKICVVCKTEKLIEFFPITSKNNRINVDSYCLQCRKNYNKTREPRTDTKSKENAKKTILRQRAKKEYVEVSKNNKSCVDCGNTYPPCAMDYDHAFGEKRFSLGYAIFHSYAAIDAEIAKCVLRCAVCHRIKTHGCK